MKTENLTTAKVGATEQITEDNIISLYMDYVLENGPHPQSVYKFCKDNGITEERFYQFFGSFEGVQKTIWKRFYDNAFEVINRTPEYESFNTREKLLTFYYTFFEILTANRSYVLINLSQGTAPLKNLEQLKGLRVRVKDYASELVREDNERSAKFTRKSETVFSEATWLQLMFLIRFWLKDDSARFESTDVAIEKSVNTVFDIFDTTPLDRVIDFGKFLWKERMS
ncbi:TetR/AcrR family transcriptional regulator [Antarcticibacterium sp. 1MA-6-2]|uniref:TetR/AcrR family transcriptional regulator n=1 Tax=Antarcticibacterium sp. 1MA-6-2 TaxID=2908210 RepID=UPI001F2A71B2|nr:TetR family transcriptional regulator C-terminal domain-containing protein [Antarcticibacterium sp. 1MA-6-2]UJH92399.1 TetR/AcrR family transcriptional regulator [Antarcticibacterium sp. 1MA-6-2]